MTTYTIKSRKLGQELDFYMPDGGGYIRLEDGANTGTLGKQICHGGDFKGSTMTAYSEDDFKAQCRRWYRQRLAWMEREGLI